MAKKDERKIIITYSDEPVPEDFSIHFMDLIHDMRRVIDAREEREAKAKAKDQSKIKDN